MYAGLLTITPRERRESMNAKALLAVVGIAVLRTALAQGEEPAERPKWDQKKAVDIIKKAVAVEDTGQPWDKIKWLTDPEQAIARARKENKPILVYGYLKNKNGPAAAPC